MIGKIIRHPRLAFNVVWSWLVLAFWTVIVEATRTDRSEQ